MPHRQNRLYVASCDSLLPNSIFNTGRTHIAPRVA